MKALLRIFATGCLVITILGSSGTFARTWTSADGSNSFEGDLIAYDDSTGKVTVNHPGEKIAFDGKLLSAKNITFLKSAEAIPTARKTTSTTTRTSAVSSPGYPPKFRLPITTTLEPTIC